MPYAIYDLRYNGGQEEFVSFKKQKYQVVSDAVAHLIGQYHDLDFKGLDNVGNQLKEATDLAGRLASTMTLTMVHVIDPKTEQMIDTLLDFLNESRRLIDDFNHIGNREAAHFLSQLEFGAKRALDRRFYRRWPDAEADWKATIEKDIFLYSYQIGVFRYVMGNALNMDHFFQTMNSLVTGQQAATANPPEVPVGLQ